jgi:hypothetical protein
MQKHISTLRRKPSAVEKAELLEQRCHLTMRITTFEWKGNAFLQLDDHVHWVTEVNGESMEEDEIYYSNDSDADDLPKTMLETKALALPSSLAPGDIERLGLDKLAGKEAALQQGQINNALEGLRMALREKSLSFRTPVHNSKSQRTSLKAWDNVNKQDVVAKRHKCAYDNAQKALIRLDIGKDYLSTLQDITPEDMKMAGDVTEENRVGQRSRMLAWFWRLCSDSPIDEVEVNPRMKECECIYGWIWSMF